MPNSNSAPQAFSQLVNICAGLPKIKTILAQKLPNKTRIHIEKTSENHVNQ
jgi:hypothetical protein